jgi:hypothetical protein
MPSHGVTVYGNKCGTLKYNNVYIETRIPVLRIKNLLENADKHIVNQEYFELSTCNNKGTCELILFVYPNQNRYLHLEYVVRSEKGKILSQTEIEIDLLCYFR